MHRVQPFVGDPVVQRPAERRLQIVTEQRAGRRTGSSGSPCRCRTGPAPARRAVEAWSPRPDPSRRANRCAPTVACSPGRLMVFISSKPRRIACSRHISSRYGNSADRPGTVGCRSQSIGAGGHCCAGQRHLEQQVGALDLHLEHLQREIARARRWPCRCAHRTCRRATDIRSRHSPASLRAIGRIHACRYCRWRGIRRPANGTARSRGRRPSPQWPPLRPRPPSPLPASTPPPSSSPAWFLTMPGACQRPDARPRAPAREIAKGAFLTLTSPAAYHARPGLAWARSSAGEHSLHTRRVTGSIPVAPTTPYHVSFLREQARILRSPLCHSVDATVDRCEHSPIAQAGGPHSCGSCSVWQLG